MSLRDDLSADLADIFAGAEADEATVTPVAGGPAFPLRGFYRAPYKRAELFDLGADSNAPRFLCHASAAAVIRRDDMLSIPGVGDLYVAGIQSPGTGRMVLVLTEDAP